MHYACEIFKWLLLALRRHGSWRQDLNVELSNPFTRQIASTWSKVFEADLFASFENATTTAIANILREVEDSAAPGLKERARGQAEVALEEAKVALKKTIGVVAETINTEQKEVSRCLAPHVQNQLIDGYDAAMLERGTGSVARQKVNLRPSLLAGRKLTSLKALFHRYIADIKDEIFDGAADVILGRLANAAEAVGQALGDALQDLAEKVSLSSRPPRHETQFSFADRGQRSGALGGCPGRPRPSQDSCASHQRCHRDPRASGALAGSRSPAPRSQGRGHGLRITAFHRSSRCFLHVNNGEGRPMLAILR